MNDWFMTPGPYDRTRLTAVSHVVILSTNINDKQRALTFCNPLKTGNYLKFRVLNYDNKTGLG